MLSYISLIRYALLCCCSCFRHISQYNHITTSAVSRIPSTRVSSRLGISSVVSFPIRLKVTADGFPKLQPAVALASL